MSTFSQIYIHFVFAAKYREARMTNEWRENLYKYIAGIINNRGCKLIAIGGTDDHVHLFVNINTTESISRIMQFIKGDSSEWINKSNFTPRRFEWQKGYGAFSNSISQIDAVVKYINNQQEHHKAVDMVAEFEKILATHNIAYDSRYIIKPLE